MKKEYDLKKMKRRTPIRINDGTAEIKIAITTRLDAKLLNDLKMEADRMGLPYQSLINSILHRFVTGQLVDKKTKAP